MTREDLWKITLGELQDAIDAYRYNEYLKSRRDARLAVWICNGGGMRSKPLHINDLVGEWVDGRVLSREEHFDYLKKKVRKRKEGMTCGS